jgi:hypothetical protein
MQIRDTQPPAVPMNRQRTSPLSGPTTVEQATTPTDSLALSAAPLRSAATAPAQPASACPPLLAATAPARLPFTNQPIAELEPAPVCAPEADPKLAITPQEQLAYAFKNQQMAAEYPAFAQILKDPDAFMSDMKQRFADQTKLTPNDPYSFDFSEYGVPVMKDLGAKLGKELISEKAKLQDLHDKKPGLLDELLGTAKKKTKDLQTGIQFVSELKNEVDGLASNGKVSYRKLQELSFFGARALGSFHHDDLSTKEKTYLAGDRYLQGYKDVPISEDYRRYKEDDFSLFQGPSPVETFQKMQKPFEDGFFNKDKLEMLVLPTSEALGTDIFMRLLPYPVYFAGITDTPIKADGFDRPGGDFFLHDLRHSTAMFGRSQEYKETHHLDEAQVQKLNKMSDVWSTECSNKVSQLKDKDLAGAIDFFMFNFHHDRGYPILPSSYVNTDSNTVPRLLYGMLKLSDQDPGFQGAFGKLQEAHEWLDKFWQPKLGQEQIVTGETDKTGPAS